MKNIITYIILFLFCSKVISQDLKESFIGEIETEVETVFVNQDLYYKDVARYLKVMDSIFIKEYNEVPRNKEIEQYATVDSYRESAMIFYKIALDNRFSGTDWTGLKLYKHTLTDSFVKIQFSKFSKIIINKYTLNSKNRTRINREYKKVPLKYRFNEVEIDSIVVDKNDTKIIAGIKCYKVTVIQKGERIVRHFYWNNLKESKVITEMYVTDEIKTRFHSIVKNKLILEKFYPMYVKRYSNAFRGIYLTSIVKSVKSL